MILTRTAETLVYEWDNDFKLERIAEIPSIPVKWEEQEDISFAIDPYDLTAEEAKDLGFSKWSEDSDLMLIPLWLYPFLIGNVKTTSISGRKHNSKKKIHTDHRFGCLAYGIILNS